MKKLNMLEHLWDKFNCLIHDEINGFIKREEIYNWIKNVKSYSDEFKIIYNFNPYDWERFLFELYHYKQKPKYRNLKFLIGDEGTLQYFFKCKKCKTIIQEDHSSEIYVDTEDELPTTVCPICNEIENYHWKYYTVDSKWYEVNNKFYSDWNLFKYYLRSKWYQFKYKIFERSYEN